MWLVSLIKKIISSVVSLVIFLLIVFVVVKYQLYNPANLSHYIGIGTRLIHSIEQRFGIGGGNNAGPTFGLSDYGIVLETLPRGQSKYLVVLINNVNNNTNLDKVVEVVKILDTPVIIGINKLPQDKLQTLSTELSGYKVSYALDVPGSALAGFDSLKQYVTGQLVKYSSIVNINTLVVNTVAESVSRYAVLNNMVVLKLSDNFGAGKLRVGGETTNNYYFDVMYYNSIDEPDAPIIKEKILKSVSNKEGVLIVGFNADLLSSEAVKQNQNNNTNQTIYVSKSRLVQEAIINPIVSLYYNSGYKFYDASFDQFIQFLNKVMEVAQSFSSSNVIINSDSYGTKITIPMGIFPQFVTVKIPKQIGLIKVKKLASVTLYYMNGGAVPSDDYYQQEENNYILIYPLQDLRNVKLVITYVTPANS